MDKYRKQLYDKNNFNVEEKVVKMTPITQTKPEQKGSKSEVAVNVAKLQKKKRSALEISDAIGVYGAFDRTLSDLHKQGR
jgi:hypothetical protein